MALQKYDPHALAEPEDEALEVAASLDEAEDEAEPITQNDYLLIKAEILRLPRAGYGHALFVMFLRSNGLRIREGLRARPVDIREFDEGTFIRVVRGKQARARKDKPARKLKASFIPIPALLAAQIKDYIKGHNRKLHETIWPFGARIVEKTFRAAANRAIHRDAHPHQLRALYITEGLKRGVNPAVMGNLTGKKKVESVITDYFHLNREDRARYNDAIEI